MPVNIDSPSVQTHATLLQGVINRLAANSANSKTWCVTLVAAILVLVMDQECASAVSLALLPIGLFLFLDGYYLSLEHDFRDAYNDLVDSVHSGTVDEASLLVIRPMRGTGRRAGKLGRALRSGSIWPFYLVVTIAVALAYIVLRHALPPCGWACVLRCL